MIKVKLKAWTNKNPLELASYAGLVCYQDSEPEMGKLINTESRLFLPSHHTTFQHSYLTFFIEGIAVGDITLGLHLTSPFYNTCQRSGRYCAKMFSNPDLVAINDYIKMYWPETNEKSRTKIIQYIRKGVGFYQENINDAIVAAKNLLYAERPFAKEKYIEANAPKIAQEQLRNFIPVIFPTGLVFSVNFTALAALYESAWTPSLRFLTREMARQTLKAYEKTWWKKFIDFLLRRDNKFSDFSFIFNEDRARQNEWAILTPAKFSGFKYAPELELLQVFGEENFVFPEKNIMEPVDKLHFTPETMDNSAGGIKTLVRLSLATMGQDQRHRTLQRSKPEFTGDFYMAPIMRALVLEEMAEELMNDWINISQEIPVTLAMILAPYGAMVEYEKKGSFNALIHEHRKRLCLCAQEEIRCLSLLLRQAIKEFNPESLLLQIFSPPCYLEGKCAEGARFCGRDLCLRTDEEEYFRRRQV